VGDAVPVLRAATRASQTWSSADGCSCSAAHRGRNAEPLVLQHESPCCAAPLRGLGSTGPTAVLAGYLAPAQQAADAPAGHASNRAAVAPPPGHPEVTYPPPREPSGIRPSEMIVSRHPPECRDEPTRNESLTAGPGQLVLCDIPATFTLWWCPTATGSIQARSPECARLRTRQPPVPVPDGER
jgi:hypothetical protein